MKKVKVNEYRWAFGWNTCTCSMVSTWRRAWVKHMHHVHMSNNVSHPVKQKQGTSSTAMPVCQIKDRFTWKGDHVKRNRENSTTYNSFCSMSIRESNEWVKHKLWGRSGGWNELHWITTVPYESMQYTVGANKWQFCHCGVGQRNVVMSFTSFIEFCDLHDLWNSNGMATSVLFSMPIREGNERYTNGKVI